MRVRRLRKYRKPMTGELVTFETKQYYVTDEGLVYDGARHKYFKQYELKGYMHVDLKDDDGKWHTTIKVHGLVASCFIRLLEKGESCHHIDKNRKNNNISNLQLIDGKEHARQHSIEKWREGTMDGVAAQTSEKMKKAWKEGKYDGNTAKLSKQVAQLSLEGILVRVWPSTASAGRNGFNLGAVSNCCNGKRKTHKGFKWQYLEDYLAQHDKATVDTQPVQLEFNFL